MVQASRRRGRKRYPPKAERRDEISRDFDADRRRNRIERMFSRLKQFLRIATLSRERG